MQIRWASFCTHLYFHLSTIFSTHPLPSSFNSLSKTHPLVRHGKNVVKTCKLIHSILNSILYSKSIHSLFYIIFCILFYCISHIISYILFYNRFYVLVFNIISYILFYIRFYIAFFIQFLSYYIFYFLFYSILCSIFYSIFYLFYVLFVVSKLFCLSFLPMPASNIPFAWTPLAGRPHPLERPTRTPPSSSSVSTFGKPTASSGASTSGWLASSSNANTSPAFLLRREIASLGSSPRLRQVVRGLVHSGESGGMWRRLGVSVGEWEVGVTLDLTERCGCVRCWDAPGEGCFWGIAAYAATYSRRISSKCQGWVVGGGSAERHCRRTVYRSRVFLDGCVARDDT